MNRIESEIKILLTLLLFFLLVLVMSFDVYVTKQKLF